MTTLQTNQIGWGSVFLCDTPPKLDFVMDGMLSGTVAAIVAAGATGKSFFGLELCVSVSAYDYLKFGVPRAEELTRDEVINLHSHIQTLSERPDLTEEQTELLQKQSDWLEDFLPRASEGYIEAPSYKTAYLTAEDPKEILFDRCFNIAKDFSTGEQLKALSRVEVYSIHGESMCLINSKGEVDEECEAAANRLLELATGKRMLIIDTLRKFHQANENDSGAMTVLTQILDRIASQSKCAIVFLHHVAKGAKGSDQSASRGSTSLVDNIRFQINLQKMTEDEALELGVNKDFAPMYVKAVGAKANYRSNHNDVWLKRGEGGVLKAVDLNPKGLAYTPVAKPNKNTEKSVSKNPFE